MRGIGTLGGDAGGDGGSAGDVHRERDKPHVKERDPVRGRPVHHQHRGVQHRAQERYEIRFPRIPSPIGRRFLGRVPSDVVKQ